MEKQQDSPRFTIITVTLDAGKALRETIRSVISQSFCSFEIIIKDGGSTDGSLQELPVDARIRLLAGPDRGIYDAMNQALEEASGEYILFLNAGDTFLDETVMEKVAEAASQGHPSLVYTDYLKGPGRSLIKSPSHLSSSYLIRTMLCHQVCWFRKDCYQRYGGFDLRYQVAADYDFLVRVIHSNSGTSRYLPYPTIWYKGGGHSFRMMEESLTEVKQIRKHQFSPLRLALFYSWYNLTMPRLRLRFVETRQPILYYKLTNLTRRKR